jgi:hypothetical protein
LKLAKEIIIFIHLRVIYQIASQSQIVVFQKTAFSVFCVAEKVKRIRIKKAAGGKKH